MLVVRTEDNIEAMALALADLASDVAHLRDYGAPSDAMLEDAPILNRWTHGIVATPCLLGSVVGHPLLGSRPSVRTSEVFVVDGMAGWARTWSRWYRLGLPRGREGIRHA